jgi:putative ABC transport system permease protein
MNISTLAWRSMRRRPLSSFLTALSVALGVGLFSAIGSLRDAGEEGFHRSAGLCDLVVGPKGSPLQLVLNALYHQGASQGNIPFALYEELQKTPGVKWIAPLVVGDQYRGQRIVGTTSELFKKARLSDGNPLPFAEGRPFDFDGAALVAMQKHLHAVAGHDHDHHDEGLGEAVCGASAAREAQLSLGDSFFPAHDVSLGSGGGDVHEDLPFKVVGVLAPTGTPLDRAIFISAGDFYLIDGHQVSAEEKQALAGTARDPLGLSALLLRSQPGFYHINLYRSLNARLDAQAARPADEIRNLFRIVGGVDQLLRLIAILVLVVALLGVMVALTNAMGMRAKEFALLRALGAKRRTLLGMVVLESACISGAGAIAGLLISMLGTWLASAKVHALTGVALSPLPSSADAILWIAVILAGAAAGLLPALRAYQTEPAGHLSSAY